MSEQFGLVIYAGFILSLIGCCITFCEMINKKVQNSSLTMLTGVLDTTLGFCAFVWVVWASFVRLGRNGKVCAGATMNVNEVAEPYAYDQGSFLQVILVLMYTIPPTLFVATNCGCL